MRLRRSRRSLAAAAAALLAVSVAGCAVGGTGTQPVTTVTLTTTTVPPVSPASTPPVTTVPGTSAAPGSGTGSAPASGAIGGSGGPAAPARVTRLAVTAADRSAAARIVARLSTVDKAASVIVADGSQLAGTDLLRRYHFGGVILMATRGIVDGTAGGTPAQVAAVTARLRSQAAADPTGAPPLIGTDQEYGDVVRLEHGFTEFPGQSQLAAIGDTATAAQVTRQVAAAAAQELLAVGVTVDFAPVSDVLPTGGAPSAIGDRSYGSDPRRVGTLVAAAVTGYQDAGVAAVLKHFPGLGRVATDTHTALAALGVSCSSWNAHEAVPLRAGIAAGVSMVMTGHVLLPAVGDTTAPASVDRRVVSGLLRGSGSDGCSGMRYAGITVTDSLQMEPIANVFSPGQAAVRALDAGEDLLLMPVDPAGAVRGIVGAVNSGQLARSRLDAAATAVLALRLATARIPRPPMGVIDSPAHRALAAEALAAAGGP